MIKFQSTSAIIFVHMTQLISSFVHKNLQFCYFFTNYLLIIFVLFYFLLQSFPFFPHFVPIFLFFDSFKFNSHSKRCFNVKLLFQLEMMVNFILTILNYFILYFKSHFLFQTMLCILLKYFSEFHHFFPLICELFFVTFYSIVLINCSANVTCCSFISIMSGVSHTFIKSRDSLFSKFIHLNLKIKAQFKNPFVVKSLKVPSLNQFFNLIP